MTRTAALALLNFNPQVLFHSIQNPDQDPKCRVIAMIVKIFVEKLIANGSEIERAGNGRRRTRYSLLSEETRLPLSEARQRVSGFVGKGVSFASCKRVLRISCQSSVCG